MADDLEDGYYGCEIGDFMARSQVYKYLHVRYGIDGSDMVQQ